MLVAHIHPTDGTRHEIAIDWTKLGGPYIRLTKGQWTQLLHEIDRMREAEGWRLVRVKDDGH